MNFNLQHATCEKYINDYSEFKYDLLLYITRIKLQNSNS